MPTSYIVGIEGKDFFLSVKDARSRQVVKSTRYAIKFSKHPHEALNIMKRVQKCNLKRQCEMTKFNDRRVIPA